MSRVNARDDFQLRIQGRTRSLKTDCLASQPDGRPIEGCQGRAMNEVVCDNHTSLRCCDNDACIQAAAGEVWNRHRKTVRAGTVRRVTWRPKAEVAEGVQ